MGLLGEKANEAYIPLGVPYTGPLAFGMLMSVIINSQNEKRTNEWLTSALYVNNERTNAPPSASK